MAVARDAPQLERADLGDVRFEPDRHEVAGLAVAFDLDELLDRIELRDALGVGIDERAGGVVLARVAAAKNRNVEVSPTTRPSSSSGSATVEPSSRPCGATHSAFTGGAKPGIAGIALSMPM